MSRRRKNMLEAFRASAIEGHTPRVPSQEVSAGGPFAPAKRDPEPPRARSSSTGGSSDAVTLVRRVAPLLVGVAMLIGVAFWVGRLSSDQVDAREVAEHPQNRMLPREGGARVAEGAAAAPQAPSPGVDASSGEGTLDDERFLDPANLYTVRVIEYRRDERGVDLARNCYAYLRRQGLPAIWPVEQGSALILYVGASSDLKELESLTRYVAELPGPPPLSRPREFEGAYRVNIDDVVYR
jgi:hypothetical protein